MEDSWRSYATVCRLCMQKDGFMLGIYNNVQGKDKSISKKIVDCTALSVCQGDGLPNVVCHRCLFKIEFCLEFRQMCFISDATLRQLSGLAKATCINDKEQNQMTLYDQMVNGDDENIVMVVDPNSMDYESEYESDTRHSDVDPNELEGKNVSMCRFCDHAFTDKAECTEHESNSHNSDRPYNCSICVMSFGDRLVYSAHMKNVHKNDKPYNCPQCDRTFARRSDLRKHTIVHTGVKPYTCSVCLKSFSRNTNLSKHMRIHSGTKPFVCPKCPRTFTSRGDLNRHAMVHTGQKPFRCNFCNMSFGRKDKLFRHEKRHWPQNMKDKSKDLQISRDGIGLPEFNNDVVKDQEKSEENMVINLDPFNHSEFNHSESSLNRSPQKNDYDGIDRVNNEDSPSKFSENHTTDDSLSSSRSPEANKPHKCKICSRSFSTPDNLKYHISRHSGIRPFCCHICTKSFIRKRELDRHVVTHTGLRPFKCMKCPKSFGRKDKLVRHARIHDRRAGDTTPSEKLFIRKPIFLQQQQQQKNLETNT
ncbi:zinc finger protein 271-like [Anthonomus grandis grandis]|uniref:zinc finger protein 271-like n=1 Tax=Anthonomus grandis grandis TaxID=2921223 RepID=UPI0021663B44|nr:zinc finger protein 271-like [Anthonomus grandis grandis]